MFGESTKTGNRTHLIKRIAWRLQALAEGDLSERARRLALEIANDADLQLRVHELQFVNERLAFPGCEDRGQDGRQHQDPLGDDRCLCSLKSEHSGSKPRWPMPESGLLPRMTFLRGTAGASMYFPKRRIPPVRY